MTGFTNDVIKHCRIPFGCYVQCHEDTGFSRNSMEARTLGCICLGPSDNVQGGYHFLSLNTGDRLHRRSWKMLPIPDLAIQRVELLSQRDHQPKLISFSDKMGNNVDDSIHDITPSDLPTVNQTLPTSDHITSIPSDVTNGISRVDGPIDPCYAQLIVPNRLCQRGIQ